MSSTRTWILALAALSLFVGIGAAAQSGAQYTIVKDTYGNVVTEVAGNTISFDSTTIPATNWEYITCPNNGVYSSTGCAGGVPPVSVYVSSTRWTSATMANLAARTPSAATKCTSGWWAVYLQGGWQCKLKSKAGTTSRINQ